MPYPSCWDIDTGKKIGEFKGFRGGLPASVATHGSRIILTHVQNYFGINEEFDMHSYRDRVVWDFRSGKTIAEWVPVTQVTETGLNAPNDKRTEFGPSVISPTGRYIAEGTNGKVLIYELPKDAGSNSPCYSGTGHGSCQKAHASFQARTAESRRRSAPLQAFRFSKQRSPVGPLGTSASFLKVSGDFGWSRSSKHAVTQRACEGHHIAEPPILAAATTEANRPFSLYTYSHKRKV